LDKTQLILYSGELNEIKGSIETQFHVNSALGVSEENAEVELAFPTEHQVLVYIIEGELEFEENSIKEHHLVSFDNDGSKLKFRSNTKSRYLVLSAEPIKEPVATYGPFVMNTEFELQEAMLDFQQGKMGYLIETFV